MKTVRVTMSDEAFASLSEQAKKAGLPGIASFLLKKAGALTDDAEAADMKKKAILKASRQRPGATFRLKDLFSEDSWAAYSKGARIRAGRQFYDAIKVDGIVGIEALQKRSGNHQFYARTTP
jgi:Domain of unknown function (DUF1413)